MAERRTPTQIQRALEAVWKKFEKTRTPFKEIREEDLMSYYGKKRDVGRRRRDDLLTADANKRTPYDPRAKTGCGQNDAETRDNIYAEENGRAVPLATSHMHGHWRTDLEGRRLFGRARVDRKSEYGRAGLVFDDTLGLPWRYGGPVGPA